MSNMLRKIKRQRKVSYISNKNIERKTELQTKEAMTYECSDCGKRWIMWLQTGLEEGGKNHKPVPFTIHCKYCKGVARHVDWHEDIHLEEPIAITEGMDYFANCPKWDCGKPIYR